MRRLLLVLGWALSLLVLTVATAPAAGAHASLVSTDPDEGEVLASAPTALTLTFDEAVSLNDRSTALYDARGRGVGSSARSVDETVTVKPEGRLADGTYVLAYRVVSADGHPIAGSLSFSVGAPSASVVEPRDLALEGDGAVTAVHGVLQGLAYLGLLVACGIAVFLALAIPGVPALATARGRLLRVLRPTAVIAVVGALLLVPVGAVYQLGLGLDGLGTRAAWSGFHTLEGLPFLFVATGLAVAVATSATEPPDKVDRLIVTTAVVGALASTAIVGHTRGYGPAVLVIGADVVHVVAASAWFGGLVGLALTLPSLAKRERLAAVVLARFSSVAGGLLVLVALAGTLLGWRILGSWSALVSTSYGLLLLGKVALVALVAAVAGWNRLRLLPSVVAASGHAARVDAAGRLRAAVRLEAVGLVVVVLVTGFLVNQVPREAETTRTAPDRRTVTAVADDVRVVGHLSPGRVGTNTVTVQVQDLAGEPLEPYAAPTVSVRSEQVDLGPRPVTNVDSGTYRSRVVLPQAGRWEVRVSVRTDAFTSPVLTLTVEVRAG